MLKHEDYTVKSKAAEFLGQRVPQEVITFLKQEFNRGNTDIKKDIIKLLGNTKSAAAIPLLISALSEGYWSVCSEAVSQIGLLAIWLDSDILEDAVTALIHLLQSDSETSVRSSAAIYLGTISRIQALPVLIEALPVLIEALSKDDQVVRSSAAYALGYFQDRSAISALTRSLQDEDDVCEAVIKSLRILNAVEVLPTLRKLLPYKPANVRGEIILCLGFFGNSQDIPILYKSLNDQEFFIRISAAYSLTKLNNRKGIPILENALKNGNTDARKWALIGLQNFQGKVGLSTIFSTALKDDDYSIRKEAVNFLEAFKESPEIVNQLKVALNSQDEKTCRNAMDAARILGNAKVLSRLREIARTTIVVERPLEAISAIQSRCGFYNYDLIQLERPQKSKIRRDISEKLLHNKVDTLIQEVKKISEEPKMINNFDQRGANIGVNVASEGSNIKFIQYARQNINISEQDLAESAQKIQDLLNQLAQIYPHTTQPQKQTFIQKFLEQIESSPELIKIIFAGGVEGLKILCPPAGISIEMAKGLYESVQKHYSQA